MLTKNVWPENVNVATKHNRLRSMPKWLWKMTNTRAIIGAVTLSFTAGAAQAASLNKCVDAYGKVTYSNMSCKGANQIQKIEIDPAPPVPPPAPSPVVPKVEVPVYVMPEKLPGFPSGPVLGPVPGYTPTPMPGPVATPPSGAAVAPAPALPDKKATVKLETFGTVPKKQSPNTCDTLTDKLGLVLDKMDAARRKGYTAKEMDQWNLEIKGLERKKQQAGCF